MEGRYRTGSGCKVQLAPGEKYMLTIKEATEILQHRVAKHSADWLRATPMNLQLSWETATSSSERSSRLILQAAS